MIKKTFHNNEYILRRRQQRFRRANGEIRVRGGV